ncbi:MAG: tyrosine-type recombinase/integrase [Armatimonadota bacterium]
MPTAGLRLLPATVDGPPPWDEACREYLESLQLQRYSPHTVSWYRSILAPFGRELLATEGTDDPAAVSERTVLRFLHKLGTEGMRGRPPVGARRLNHYREGISLFYEWLRERGYVQHNPVERVKKIREPRRLIPVLTETQVAALLQQPNRDTFLGIRDYCFLLLLLDTGMRLSEGLGLRLADINLEEDTVTVLGKGNKERRLALSPRLLMDLKPYLRKRAAALTALGLPDARWVFPNDVGGRLTPKAVQQRLKLYGKAAGISGVRVSPHTLRHTYAVNFVRSGGDPFTLQKILGHSSLDTSRRYCELADEDVLRRQRELTPLATMNLGLRPPRRIPRTL